jgi:Ca2+/Na+ antiporter
MKFFRIFLIMNAIGFLLSMASVRLRISYFNELGLKISYLCFSYTIFPQKEKKRQKAAKDKKQKEAKQKKENIFTSVYHEKGLNGLLHLLKALSNMAGSFFKKIFQHIRASKLSLHVAVADEDAAQTALLYGKVCAIVYPSFSMLTQTIKCKKFEVAVVPNFKSKKSEIQGSADIKIRVAILLAAVIQALLRYMKTIKPATISDKTKEQKAVQ